MKLLTNIQTDYFCKNTPTMATNLTNNQNGTIDNEVQTVPKSITGDGTISTQGIWLIGDGTSFKDVLYRGAYIFNGSDEIRRVSLVQTDVLAVLEDAFSSDIAASSDFLYIGNKEAQCKSMSVLMPLGESGATINGADMIAGVPVTNPKTGNSNTSRQDFVNPVIINATSTTVDYAIQY